MQNDLVYTKVEYSIDGVFAVLLKKVVNTTYRYDVALYRLRIINDYHFKDDDIYDIVRKSL